MMGYSSLWDKAMAFEKANAEVLYSHPPRKQDGTFDMRFTATWRYLAAKREHNSLVEAAWRAERIEAGENKKAVRPASPPAVLVEQEPPATVSGIALRPSYLVNDAGGVIEWGKWVKRTAADAGIALAAMVFSDGRYVTASGKQGRIDIGRGGTLAFDDMRAIAHG